MLRNDTTHLNHQTDELSVRLGKYEKRIIEFEEQSQKHNDLHERMKERLKQMTYEMEEKNEIVKFNFRLYLTRFSEMPTFFQIKP